jgi:hypothetical protein
MTLVYWLLSAFVAAIIGLLVTITFEEPTRRWLVSIGRWFVSLDERHATRILREHPSVPSPPQVAWERLSGIIGRAQQAQTPAELAERLTTLIEIRNTIRQQLWSAAKVYNSELDEIEVTLRRLNGRKPGARTTKRLSELLDRLANKWPSKLDEIERLRASIASELGLQNQ